MKQLVIVLFLILPGLQLFAQQDRSLVKKGNELYQQQKYKDAEAAYRQALVKRKTAEGNFNLGDAEYKQKQFDKAAEQYNQLAEKSKDPAVAAGAYHNLGNTLMQGNKLKESIEAYERSLINNPNDEQTRYNLAYAQEKLKNQQQQDKNKNKNDKNNKDKNKDNKDKDKNKDKKDQDKDKKDQDKKDQNKDQNQQQKQQQQPKISKEDAQRMLDALQNDEKATQDKLKNQKLKGAKKQVGKDW